LLSKCLMHKVRGVRKRLKAAVVPTYSISSVAELSIILGRHVFAPQDSQEGRQGAPLL